MKSVKTAVLFLAASSFLVPPLRAQDKPKGEEKTVHATQVKVQIVFTEFEGDKKIKSMPYASIFAATGQAPDSMKLRIGSRVPLFTGKDGGLQYIDVGTNLDCTADRLDEGKFGLRIALERSWIQGDVPIPIDSTTQAQTGAADNHFKEPVIGQYKTTEYLIARDGQTIETTVATDPLNGRLLKIELTLNVLK
ncbi:MAG: hypothetical protein JO119_18705 [Acidobacteria bacterium]|nr:hypothetical protein [Acidobacteriota bacterium]